jgi:hypothetical protein
MLDAHPGGVPESGRIPLFNKVYRWWRYPSGLHLEPEVVPIFPDVEE